MQEPSPPSDGARPDPPASVPPIAGDARPEAEKPASPTPARAAVARCLVQIRRATAVVWKFLSDVARYYWGMREPLWEYLAGFAPNLMSESVRMREVRMAPYESHALAEYDSTGWKATVPGRCAVCGEPRPHPPVDATRSIEDASRPCCLAAATCR